MGYIDFFDEREKDVNLVKIDSDGNRIWSYAVGGVGEDVGHSVKQTSDGGYIIAGWTSSLGAGGQNVYIFKTDSDGLKIWGLAFEVEGNEDAGYSVQQTTDGGYIIPGTTTPGGSSSSSDWNGPPAGTRRWEAESLAPKRPGATATTT